MQTATLEYPPCDYLHTCCRKTTMQNPSLCLHSSQRRPVGYADSLNCHLSSTAQLSLFRSWLGEQPWAWWIQEQTPLISDVNVSRVLWPESLHFHRSGCHLFLEFPSHLASHDTSKLLKLQSWAFCLPWAGCKAMTRTQKKLFLPSWDFIICLLHCPWERRTGSTVEFEYVWCTIKYEGCTISSRVAGMASQCQLPCI